MELKEKTQRAVVIAAALLICGIYFVGLMHEAENARAEDAVLTHIELSQWTPDSPGLVNEYQGIIRFHVIANSDSEEDQALKLHVRNCVVMKLQNALMACTDIEETRVYIERNLALIEEWATDCVEGWGYDYDVKARIGVSAIPAKQYDDLYFPAGNYEALTITIGEGRGQNWWCVVFPPLCLVDATDEAYGELFSEDEDGRIVLRSKLKEILARRSK